MTDQDDERPDDRPLRLSPTDRLSVYLEVDSSGERSFLLTPRSVTANLAEKRVSSACKRYVIGGVEHWDHWSDPTKEALESLHRLPECKRRKGSDAHVATFTDFNAVMLHRMWGDRIIGEPQALEALRDLVKQWEEGDAVAMATAKFKREGAMPKLPPCWAERVDAPLADYQRAAVAISLMSRDGFGLFMDRGTGKTPCAAQRVNVEAAMVRDGLLDGGDRKHRMLRVLVVCPPQVRLNWQREFERFSWLRGRVSVIRGGLPERVGQLAEMIRPEEGVSFSVSILGYDTGVRTVDYVRLCPWDLIITDESQFFKDPNTKRWKEFIARIRDSALRRLALTGSPMGNSPLDLWPQFEFMREGGSGFIHHKMFRTFHGQFERVEGSHGVEKLVGLRRVPLLQERLARMTFSVTKDEAGLKLPQKLRSVHEVQMLPYQADVYRRLQEQLALEIEDKLSKTVVDEVTVNNVLVMLLRLHQVTNGFITYDAKVDPDTGVVLQSKRVAELCPTNPRVDALMDIIKDEERDPRGKTIVWALFRHNMETISARLREEGIKHVMYHGGISSADRDAAADAFNRDRDCKVIVGNAATMAEGLTLVGYDVRCPEKYDTNCDVQVFYSYDWSALKRAQAEDRPHRRGTRVAVNTIDMCVPDTIDEEILARVQGKRDVADKVADVRAVLDRVLLRKAVLEIGQQ
jgi:hypothetical protein